MKKIMSLVLAFVVTFSVGASASNENEKTSAKYSKWAKTSIEQAKTLKITDLLLLASTMIELFVSYLF